MSDLSDIPEIEITYEATFEGRSLYFCSSHFVAFAEMCLKLGEPMGQIRKLNEEEIPPPCIDCRLANC